MLTVDFPKDEKYGLTSQIRRAAVSISSNIAEGAGINSNKEFNHFLGVSNGSANELQTQLIISKDLDLIDARVDQILDELNQIQKMIYVLQKKINARLISYLNTHIL